MFWKNHKNKIVIALFLFLSGCYVITSVTQPSQIYINESFTSHLVINTEPDPVYGLDTDPKPQIVGLLVVNDWQVDSVYFSGTDITPSSGYCTFLHPDSADRYPGDGTGKVDYWADSLEARWPSGPDREWRVYQSVDDVKPNADYTTNDLYVDFTVGTMTGSYNIGYFVSNASLDFDEEHYYDLDTNNTILIQNPSAITLDDKPLKQFYLFQNYPNPFNPTTEIKYQLENGTHVELAVYNALGEKIQTLVRKWQSAGTHTATFKAEGLASGLYYYSIRAGEFHRIRKMILIR